MNRSTHRINQRTINRLELAVLLVASAAVLPACQSEGSDTTSSPSAAAGTVSRPVAAVAGKVNAPITLDYSINGAPVVGEPMTVDLTVTTPLTEAAVMLHTRMSEVGSMTFPASQPESTLMPPLAGSEERELMLTLTPQREGRLFLVVSAEVETQGGTMMKSLSVPIQVGRGSAEARVNDSLVEGSDGEMGISLPAQRPR